MSSQETVKRLADLPRTGQAVFATDFAERIVLWNAEAEHLFGRPAQSVLGKHCYDVLCGRDSNGNLYCHEYCPVAYQAREKSDDPVRPFPLSVRTGADGLKDVVVSLSVIPNPRPALSTVVHTLREAAAESPAPNHQAERSATDAERRAPNAGGTDPLTLREKEVLRCLAEGLPTRAIARKLSIAPVTVRNHVQNLLQKLEVHTKLAAVAFAHRHALLRAV